MEADDDLFALLGRRKATAQRIGSSSSSSSTIVPQSVVPVPLVLPLVERTPGDDDILAILANRPAPRKVHYEQRSEQLLAHARDQKQIIRAEASATREKEKAKASEKKIDAVVAVAPSMAKIVGRSMHKRTDSERADAALQLAVMPTIKRDGMLGVAQHRSQRIMAAAIETTQCEWLNNFIYMPSVSHEEALATERVLAQMHQFDEAMQRLKASMGKQIHAKLRTTAAPRSVKMFCQQVMFKAWADTPALRTVEDEPYFIKPLRLQEQDGLSIAEALLRRSPIRIEDAEHQESLVLVCSVLLLLLLQYGGDRYAANIVAMEIVWFLIGIGPPNCWPHWEPCWSHGMALAKSSAYKVKELIQIAVTFSRLTQNATNMDALRTASVKVLRPAPFREPRDRETQQSKHVPYGRCSPYTATRNTRSTCG